ncbi:MAG: SPOR domain-containing protein [Acetobacteraceae bacterium]|nr:SPOR domain-containing protein [Acetobacteraceae bacterium]
MSEQTNAAGPMYRASHDDDRGIDKGTMRLLYGMGAGGLVILAGIAAYSLTPRSGGDLPVVQPDPRPMRVRPDNPGGMVVAPGQKVSNPDNSRLVPGTEEPNPGALMAIPDPTKLPVPPPARPVVKTFTVQLSTAKSEVEAQAAWDRLAKKMPDVVGQRRPLFLKSNEAGPAPWRLRTGGFTDSAQAKAFCEKVKAKGGQCTVSES